MVELTRIRLTERQKAILLELATGKAVLASGGFRDLPQCHVPGQTRWTQVYLEPQTVRIMRDHLNLIKTLDAAQYPSQPHYSGTFCRLTGRGWNLSQQIVTTRYPSKRIFYV